MVNGEKGYTIPGSYYITNPSNALFTKANPSPKFNMEAKNDRFPNSESPFEKPISGVHQPLKVGRVVNHPSNLPSMFASCWLNRSI